MSAIETQQVLCEELLSEQFKVFNECRDELERKGDLERLDEINHEIKRLEALRVATKFMFSNDKFKKEFKEEDFTEEFIEETKEDFMKFMKENQS